MPILDDGGQNLVRYFNKLPPKSKHPQYYVHISDPVDLQTIESCVNRGGYQSAEQFDRDLLRMCQNNLRYYGRHSPEGEAALKIRKTYNTIKQEYHTALFEILESGSGKEGAEEDVSTSASAAAAAAVAGARCFERRAPESECQPEDECIRCPCGLYRDEGLMVQCEQCLVWQHGDCVGLPEGGMDEDANYLCEK